MSNGSRGWRHLRVRGRVVRDGFILLPASGFFGNPLPAAADGLCPRASGVRGGEEGGVCVFHGGATCQPGAGGGTETFREACEFRLASPEAIGHGFAMMKSPGKIKFCIFVLVLAACFSFSTVAEAKPPKWEYIVVPAVLHTRNLERMLNEQGAQGWELVALTRQDVAIFKRARR